MRLPRRFRKTESAVCRGSGRRPRLIQNPVPRGVWVRFPPPAPAILSTVRQSSRTAGRTMFERRERPMGRTPLPRNDSRRARSCWPRAPHPGCGHRLITTPLSDRVEVQYGQVGKAFPCGRAPRSRPTPSAGAPRNAPPSHTQKLRLGPTRNRPKARPLGLCGWLPPALRAPTKVPRSRSYRRFTTPAKIQLLHAVKGPASSGGFNSL